MERMISVCETAHATTLMGERERVRALFKSWQSMGLPSAMRRSITRLSVSVCSEPAKDPMRQLPIGSRRENPGDEPLSGQTRDREPNVLTTMDDVKMIHVISPIHQEWLKLF